jgi:hypothetical protein|uniref:Carboxypeptidase regulatory-like domain-containing protein n=1 Tax=candidate division WOR-3 bacterium TaxID=2052148 RepID=A0A7C6AGA5_UNCW3
MLKMNKIIITVVLGLGLISLGRTKEIGEIRGRVFDEVTGKPIIGASISIKNYTVKENGFIVFEEPPLKRSFSGKNGEFIIYIPPGKYAVVAECEGYGSRGYSIIEVLAGEVCTRDFPLIPPQKIKTEGTSKIVGKVLDDSTGEPLIGANVIVEGTAPEYGAATDEKGEYLIPFVPIGVYSVTATYLGYEKETLRNVVVTSDKITTLDFRLKPARVDTLALLKNLMGSTTVFIYPPQDTTLPERYVRKKLFELNWGKGPGEIGELPDGSGPGGLAIDDSGNIYILANIDPGQLRIVVFDSTGRFLFDTNINYEWKKIMETNLGYAPGYFNCLGIDSQGNYLIGPTIDAHLYTFDRDGNYVRKDTTDECLCLSPNFLSNSNFHRSLRSVKKIKSDTVIITLSDIETGMFAKQWKIRPKEWIMHTQYPHFDICNIDAKQNSYFLILASTESKKDKNRNIFYAMVNKYDKNGQLLAEIPLGFESCEEARAYVTTKGEVYVLTYYIRCLLPDNKLGYPDKKPFVSKWVLESKKGEK